MNKKKKSTNIFPYPGEASKEKQSVPDGERPVDAHGADIAANYSIAAFYSYYKKRKK